MDIETAESLALRGMLRTLETYSPDFVVEVLPETEQELRTLFRQLGAIRLTGSGQMAGFSPMRLYLGLTTLITMQPADPQRVLCAPEAARI